MTRLLAYSAYALGSVVFLAVALQRGSALIVTGSALFLSGTLLLLVSEVRQACTRRQGERRALHH